MAGPWEKYAAESPSQQASGPWAKYAGAGAAAAPKMEEPSDDDPYDRSMILPLSRNKETGEIDFTVPGLLKGMYESGKAAVTAPGRAMRGEFQVMGDDGHVTPEAIQESTNMAVWASPAAPGRVPLGPKPLAKAKPEGMQVAEAATRQGIDLPRAVVSDKASIQQAGKTVANIPIAGAPLRKASEKAIGQLDDAARNIEQGYGTGSPAGAGSMVRSDVSKYATKTLPKRVGAKYDAVDDMVQPDIVTPLTNTREVAADILTKRKNAMIQGDSKAVAMISEAANSPQGLNYYGLKDLRTSVGELMNNPAALTQAKMTESEVKRIYSALTDDLENAVQRSGGDDALAAWKQANQFAAKTSKDRKALDKIIGRDKSDEAVFQKLQNMAGSTSTADIQNLARARSAVSKETWDELSSAVLSRMGRDADGNFSPDRFLTAYGKLSDNGKKMLFNTTGKKGLAKSLDDIAMVSRRFKQLNQYANPSGTAQSVLQYAIGAGTITNPLTTLSGMAGGRVVASLLAKPATAEKVAQWAKAYEVAARSQSPKAKALLDERAKALSLIIASERSSTLPALNNPGKAVAADEDNEPVTDQVGNQSQGGYDPFTI